ncbi:MAG: hypothetical protein GY913_27900 [Proteobacteria bacterium]|nr:hypothetical protein [Pseudomonadota bacterium]MCP4920734.1 hypothetical protein [Pseudomonadota bacterium]
MRETSPVHVLAVALGSLIAVTWPLAIQPLHVLAHPLGEGNNHVWMLWRAFQAGPVANWPDGVGIPFMDVVNLPLGIPVLLHPALGHNAVVVGNLLLAFAGAWWLCRELGGSSWGALTAGVAGMAAPVLSGLVDFAITESLPVGWLALHMAALLRWEKTRAHAWWVASGLALAAFALSGWYHAFFGVVVEVPFAIWLVWRSRKPLPVLGQGALALALVLPRFLQFLEVKSMWAARFHGPSPFPPEFRPHWRQLPVFGTDVLNLVLPSVDTVVVSKSVYVGLATLTLALVAKERRLLLLVVPLWLLTLGFWLSVAGNTQVFGGSVTLPASWLVSAFPELGGLSHWHRAAAPASIVLAAVAGLGAGRLVERWPRTALVWPVVILLDSLLLSQTPWPRPMTDPASHPVYAYAVGTGALLELPFDNQPRPQFSQDLPRSSNLWQATHGRPVAENMEGDDALLHDDGVRGLHELCLELGPATRPVDWEAIGVDDVVVFPDKCTRPDDVRDELERQLGPGLEVEGAWLFSPREDVILSDP